MKFSNVTAHQGEFFKVLGGTDLSQLAVMTIKPGGTSGYENEHTGDQVVYIIEGQGDVKIGEEQVAAAAGDAVIIPKGARHEIFNTGDGPLFFLNMYTPPQY